jgi:hypothetical protein
LRNQRQQFVYLKHASALRVGKANRLTTTKPTPPTVGVIISLALMPGRGGFALLVDAIGGLGRRLRRIAGFGNAVLA